MKNENITSVYSRRTCLAKLLVSTAPLMVGSGCGTIVKTVMLQSKQARKVFSPPLPDHFIGGTAWVNQVSRSGVTIPVLHLQCPNYYSCGYHHGRLFAHIIRENVQSAYKIAAHLVEKKLKKAAKLLTVGEERSIVDTALKHAWAIMEPFVPQEELDEMAGMAHGLQAAGVTDVPLEIIHHVMAAPDLTETSCSALIAKDTATSDGHIWQLRILDYGAGSGLEKHPLITVYHATRPGDNTYVNIGWVGFIGLISGMNERRVAISEMGMGVQMGETLAGIPMIFLLKNLMRYADSAEAGAGIIRSAPRNNWYTYGIGDSMGGAIGMITSRYKCDVYPVNTHSVIDYGGGHVFPQYRDVMYAGHKNALQCKLTGEMLGTFNLARIQEMARKIRMDSNLHTVIYDLTTGSFWVANRINDKAASDCQYVEFPLSEWNPGPDK